MSKLQGLVASQGIAVGQPAFLPDDGENIVICKHIQKDEVEDVKKALTDAIESAKRDVNSALEFVDSESIEYKIFKTHLSMLEDTAFLDSVYDDIQNNLLSADYALKKTVDFNVQLLNEQDDEYLRARAVDITDSYERVFHYLANGHAAHNRFTGVESGAIVIAKNIKPSEAVLIRDLGVAGLIVEQGSRYGHMAIMAQAWNIPMLVSVKGCFRNTAENKTAAIIDAEKGFVIFSPSDAELAYYKKIIQDNYKLLDSVNDDENPACAVTKDGVEINFFANIAIPDELSSPFLKFAKGVGLFRTEFLCLDNGRLPSEDEQVQLYSDVVKQLDGKSLVIRTFDLGADKMIGEQAQLEENNPMLGWRGIRYCLDKREIFKTQLRAILRVSVGADVRVLIPMVSTVDEIISVRECFNEAKEECINAGYEVEDLPLGIMIEVPSAAILADVFAEYVDFMSIGTNDLIQYTMAADRENIKVSNFTTYFQPAVLRLIDFILKYGKDKNGNSIVSMCGEMASSKLATVLLLGMGLKNFSMASGKIPVVKRFLSAMNYSDAVKIYEKVKQCKNSEEVEKMVNDELALL